MTLIAEQTVKARPVEAALGKTKSGSEQVAIAFEILEGDDAGQTITYYGYFTEKTLDRTLDTLELCGWKGDDLSNLEGLDREVRIVIEHETDQEGYVRARVRWVNRMGGAALQSRMEAAEATSFAQRMKGTVLARRQSKPAQAPAPSNNAKRREQPLRAERRSEDDDIPF